VTLELIPKNSYQKLSQFITDRLGDCDKPHSILVASRINACHEPDREHSRCGSMAAALYTAQHAHNERARQLIQRVMALETGINPSRCHTGRLGAGYTVVGDWQAFMSLCDGWVA